MAVWTGLHEPKRHQKSRDSGPFLSRLALQSKRFAGASARIRHPLLSDVRFRRRGRSLVCRMVQVSPLLGLS